MIAFRAAVERFLRASQEASVYVAAHEGESAQLISDFTGVDPASIANIGPGFDCMAMAIDLWLDVEATEADRPAWDYEGEASDYLYAHENPFTRLNMKGRVRSEIPMGVGLGSSAAARPGTGQGCRRRSPRCGRVAGSPSRASRAKSAPAPS